LALAASSESAREEFSHTLFADPHTSMIQRKTIQGLANIISLAGVVLLVLPSMLGPEHIFPSFLSLLAYAFLFLCVKLTQAAKGAWLILTVAVVLAFLSFLHFDSVRTNYLLSWQIEGIVWEFIPLFQLLTVLPVLLLFAFDSLRNRARHYDHNSR
jgi:hypothetical protein